MKTLATFWHGGPLFDLDVACLMSFIALDFDVTIYSYDKISNIPASIRTASADEILDKSYLSLFRVNGVPSLSHFSDLFRYQIFKKTGAAWIDTDLLCLKAFDIKEGSVFLTKETNSSINGAIMSIPPGDPRLDSLIAAAMELAQATNLRWGSTGPALVTKTFGGHALHDALDSHCFYPIHWNNWWMPFLPTEFNSCERAAEYSFSIHLWNNIIVKAGYWKNLAPPKGSFLYEQFLRNDLLRLFTSTMPEDVMIQLYKNYLLLRRPDHLKLRELSAILGKRVAARFGLTL